MSLIEPDYDCSVTITVNTDVGGPGVITSFLVIAGFTILLAFFPALEVFTKWQDSTIKDLKQWYISLGNQEEGGRGSRNHRYTMSRTRTRTFVGTTPRMSEPLRDHQSTIDLERQPHMGTELRSVPSLPPAQVHDADGHIGDHVERHEPQHPSVRQILDSLFDPMHASTPQDTLSHRNQRIVALLRPLSDLQIVTGLAIIVAGLVQWQSIDFYHEQLVNAYYSLTLNSFWATRVSYMDVESDEDTWVLFLRRVVVLTSCILNIVWQFRIYFRENTTGDWDDDVGPCFRYLDRSNPLFGTIFWTAGLTLFCLALASCLFKQTRWVNEWYFAATEWLSKFLWRWFQAALTGDRFISRGTSTTVLSPRKLFRALLTAIEVLASGFAVVVYFLFLQLLDVWSYGSGFYPLTWLAYLGFYTWNVLDVVSMVLLNRDLLQEDEWAWGFGQVLPMVLILSVLFLVVDVFRGHNESAEGPCTNRVTNTKDMDTASNLGHDQACSQSRSPIASPEIGLELQPSRNGGPSSATSS
ncbi:hypothetical protein CONLIGDRAFT_91699 [Coniochaeta ligniaria NRRL 30616]|uniref:Uncharacterized protein n=1 Tax=Coniochaeta ligniaria NRRL 30616 TaxID=1408157 RepID=A0A1J7IDK5_9PEZI|nr:hypothetical protein CONLIGDRAFT_91699 [Coniochaeta ligniaria NRRL 30616]